MINNKTNKDNLKKNHQSCINKLTNVNYQVLLLTLTKIKGLNMVDCYF